MILTRSKPRRRHVRSNLAAIVCQEQKQIHTLHTRTRTSLKVISFGILQLDRSIRKEDEDDDDDDEQGKKQSMSYIRLPIHSTG